MYFVFYIKDCNTVSSMCARWKVNKVIEHWYKKRHMAFEKQKLSTKQKWLFNEKQK